MTLRKFCSSLIVMFVILMNLLCMNNKALGSNLINVTVATDTVYIWNGKDLFGLDLVLKTKNPDAESPYKIYDRILFFYGKQIGFFETKEGYSNYKLHAEWRWPEKNENANSGVLIHIQKPDTVWPRCFQIQLKKDNAGDLLGMNGANTSETIGKPKDTNPKLNPSSEKPEQEWNSCDIICEGKSISVFINGIIQNKGTSSNLENGKIGFQLEGKPIEFRNIYLIKN